MNLEEIFTSQCLPKIEVPEEDANTLYRAQSNSDGSYIYFFQWPIEKRTPCGAWISRYGEPRRFVNLEARKQFASETPAEALRQLYFRMSRWKVFLRRDMARAVNTMQLLDKNRGELWDA